MRTLPDKLRIQAGVMEMGETIAWGSDTALMYQAADEIQKLDAENAALRELLDQYQGCDYIAKLEQHISDLIAEKKALRKQLPQWVPVSERLPESNKPVLVYYLSAYWLNPSMSVALHFNGDRWRQLIGGEDMNAVTHWMPLPEPPEQEKGE